MKEMVFSVGDIFNDKTKDGCLSQYGCSRYHIPAYQRGYKWSSDKDGAVSKLLKDLWEAYEQSTHKERGEYYLQYVTTKKVEVEIAEQKQQCLEVIDGQQRLTTLSILLSVLSQQFENGENIAKDKLNYAVRDNFFSEYIYQPESLLELLQYESAKELIKAKQQLDKQDIYYLSDAAIRCYSFFLEIDNHAKIKGFYGYLKSSVKIIVNSVEKHIESETVFKNLNTNKVPLTEVELVKGLLITKVGRHLVGKKGSFQELLELRANIGRHWDEISNWANRDDVRRYYFENSIDGMEQLLHLVALHLSGKKIRSIKENENLLFNFYQERGSYFNTYQNLVAVYKTLKDWYENDKFYNYIGFLRFHKGSSNNSVLFLNELLKINTKPELFNRLREKVKHRLEETPVNELRYDEIKDQIHIHAVLLALCVFGSDKKSRFKFYDFVEEDWSLEHIFPQNPEGKKHILTESEKQVILDMLGTNVTSKIVKVLKQKERTKEEKAIYTSALKQLGPLNSIGNLCLLTGKDNTSNGCMFFKGKRANILNRIQQGSFVPKHTFEVFSKMIANVDINSLDSWTIIDIVNHAAHIETQMTELKKGI